MSQRSARVRDLRSARDRPCRPGRVAFSWRGSASARSRRPPCSPPSPPTV